MWWSLWKINKIFKKYVAGSCRWSKIDVPKQILNVFHSEVSVLIGKFQTLKLYSY